MPPTVQIVGVSSLVHGVLLVLVGAGLVLTAPLMLLDGEELPVVIFGAILGAVWAVTGVVQAGCGVQVLRRRARTATIVVNLVALVVTLPMCCALSFGVGALSAVLLSQEDAIRWFSESEV
jgi:hypothetical protein